MSSDGNDAIGNIARAICTGSIRLHDLHYYENHAVQIGEELASFFLSKQPSMIEDIEVIRFLISRGARPTLQWSDHEFYSSIEFSIENYLGTIPETECEPETYKNGFKTRLRRFIREEDYWMGVFPAAWEEAYQLHG